MLTVHATIEEEIFYPAVRLDEAEVEHASAKELIAQIELMKASDPLYDANCHDQDRAPWTMEDTWACGPAWVAPAAAQNFGLSVQQMHKFHFAMAANWHVTNGRAGPPISSTQEVVAWISSCARYIKHQFAFVMGA